MTLNDIELASYRRTGYADTPAADVVARMRQWINIWHQRLLARPGIELLRDGSITMPSVVGQFNYHLPPQVRRVLKISEFTTPMVLRMEAWSWIREQDPQLVATGTPEVWAPVSWENITPPLAQLTIMLWPVPTSVITYNLDAQFTATDMVNVTDIPLLPYEYHWLLIEAACYEEWMRKADSRAGTARQDLETGVKEMRHWLANPPDYKPVAGDRAVAPSRLGGMYPPWKAMGKEATEQRLVIADLRGGRNGTEPPLMLREPTESFQGGVKSGTGEVVEALNVDWDNAAFAHKRNGASQFVLSGVSPNPSPITGIVSFLGRHVPNSDDTQQQLWLADDASPNPNLCRQEFGATPGVVKPAIVDPVTGKGWDIQGLSFRNKYVLAYQSAQSRLHCCEANGNIRRMGLQSPVGGWTMANTGSGTYPAIPRGYRYRAITQLTGPPVVVTRRSEPPNAGLFTPSGTGTGVLLSTPALLNEGETHWELEASLDLITYYRIATIPVATTSYTDTTDPNTYIQLPLSAATGTYALQKSYRFIAIDGNRILGFGSYTPTDPQNRLEFSAVAGSTNVADEERVPLGNYIDLDEADSGQPTGLIGPVFGAFYVFKYRQVWKLVPTGNANQPYSLFPLSKIVGAIHQNTIEIGEDAEGNPVVYFMSARGPYRLGLQGLEYIGLPNEDLWFGPTSHVNFDSATVVSHAIYHSEKREMWFWFANGFADDPSMKLIYDVRRSAWARHTGPTALARCSVMAANILATKSSHDLKPYIGNVSAVGQVYKCDDPLQTDDVGTAFQAFILTKPYLLGGLGAYCTVGQGTLIAQAQTGVTITLMLVRDFGKEARPSVVLLTPDTSETRVQKIFESAGMAGAWAIQLQVGDAAPISNRWNLDAVTVNFIRDQAFV